MPSEAPFTSNHESAPGLPSVVPPSGRFIAQLFLVPFLIVATVVGLLLLVNWLVGGARSPDDFLNKLDNPNPDIRWRAAEELAQVLRRDDQLASDPRFALELAERLDRALQNAANEEKSAGERKKSGGQGTEAEPAGGYVSYLGACLGNVMLPIGVPLLGEMALDGTGRSTNAAALHHRQALWILAQLGENLRRFDQLPEARRDAVLRQLETHAAGRQGRPRQWAETALAYLMGPQAGSLKTLGIERVMTTCAQDQDPLVRSLVAFALNFWEGLPEENARLDEALVRLTRDNGHGEDLLAQFRAAEQQVDESITRSPGSKIRFNAGIALARRGSAKARVDLLEEMLNEPALRANFRLKTKDGRDIPDEAMVGNTLDATLRAVAELHRRRPELDLSRLHQALDELARSSNMALRSETERTLIALGWN